MTPERAFNASAAAGIAVPTDESSRIAILDEFDAIAQTLDRNEAIALAERLLALAQALPDSPRILRRASIVEEHFRAVEG